MLSKDANYNMDKALQELNDKRLILDLKVDIQVVLQLLVEKGIVTREEVQRMRSTVKSQPMYKSMYEYMDQAEKTAEYYKEHPEEHLRKLMEEKLKGNPNI